MLPTFPDIPKLQQVLRQVIDPEAGMNIVDLGLIYRLERVDDILCVDMTMTSPACPMGDMLCAEVEEVLRAELAGNFSVQVNLVWTPAWEPARMSDAARAHFGW